MSLAELCVRRPVFATMLVLFLVVLGVFSFFNLGVDLFPKADPPVVNVTVNLPGASPDEVTSQICLPLEEQISAISGLDELSTSASEGQARIVCRFVLERNIEDAAQDVREKVALAMKSLPPEVDPPIVTKADPDSDPILTLAVGGSRSVKEITEIADKQIRRQLQTVDGVAAIDLGGGQPREIQVVLDAEKLSAHRITVNQVAKALQSENIERPGGRIIQGPAELSVRTVGRMTAIRQFKDLVVDTYQKAPIRISDVGTVEDASAEVRSFDWLDGTPAVILAVTRQAGTSTVKVVDDVRARLRSLKATLPQDINIQVVSDQSVFIRASVAALEEHLLLGALMASLVIFLFIRNWRAVVISSIAIPASIIATFTVIKASGFSLNNMTLLALTLAVGLVIDDAIVVLENIFRHMEEFNRSPIEAAIEGTKEITLAVVATTLSLVIIFLPIAFMTGYAQKYLNSFGLTMAFAILVSMLISFTLTPMLSSRVLRRGPGSTSLSKQTRFFTWMEHGYDRLLRWSLLHPWIVIGASTLIFLSMFPLNRMLGRDFIPNDDQGEFVIHADLPEGASMEGAINYARELDPLMRKIPGVAHVLTGTGTTRVTHIHCTVELEDLDKRTMSVFQIADEARKVLDQIPRFQYKIAFPSALGGGDTFGFPVIIQLLGPDLDKVSSLARDVTDELRKTPGIVGAVPNISLSNPELRVTINRERAADLGVKASDLASTVRLLMSGDDEITTYREGGEQYPVKVILQPNQREERGIMSRLMVPSSVQGQVRLDSVAEISRGLGPSSITRFNRQFSVNINATNSQTKSVGEAAADAEKILRRLLPLGYKYKFSGGVKALDETTKSLMLAFLLAIIFMYMVLAAQFESFVHPFIIMLALPLSVPMALLSLYLTGRSLNLWSALGILLLMGIVKKNAILQVDYTNRLRAQGVALREAIIQADKARLRPILMTTFSIIAGLIPTAFGRGAGSAQRSTIAVTIIGGQMLCLLLTLLLTPVAYELVEKLRGEDVELKEEISGIEVAAPLLQEGD